MSIPLVTVYGEIRGGRIHFEDRREFDAAVRREFRDKAQVKVEVERLQATRSLDQNRGYWGVIVEAISDHTGYTPEETHEILKQKFIPKKLAIQDKNGEVKDEFVVGGSTRQMNTKDFGEYMERIKEWAAVELDIYIPDFNDTGYGHGV